LGVEALWRSQTRMIESYIVESLAAQIQEFSMADFSGMLLAREGQLDGDVFDLLYTLGDFAMFKELILSYKLVSALCVVLLANF
jgi:ADP-ribosylation factor 2-binding protein